MEKKIKINISIDECYLADELRRLANYIEESEEMPTDYETYHAVATISEN